MDTAPRLSSGRRPDSSPAATAPGPRTPQPRSDRERSAILAENGKTSRRSHDSPNSPAPVRERTAASLQTPASAPGPRGGRDSRVVLSKRGKLLKKRDHLSGWKSRYFVLDGKMLFYYTSQNKHEPKGSVYLTKGCQVAEWPEGRAKAPKGVRLFPFVIRHATTPQMYKLGATSAEDKDDWVRLLRLACESDPQRADLNVRRKFQVESAGAAGFGDSDSGPDTPVASSRASVASSASTFTEGAKPSGGAPMNAETPLGSAPRSDMGELADAGAHPEVEPEAKAETKEVWVEEPCGPPMIEPLPPPYDSILEKAKSDLLASATDPENNPNWKHSFDKDGVRGYVGTGSHASCLGVGVVPYPPQAMVAVITNADAKKEMDDMFDYQEPVAEIDTTTKIDRSVYKRVGLVSSRDFCLLTHRQVNDDGSIVIIGMSVEDDRCPPQRGHVRAEAMLGGWVIRPVGPDGMQSHCTYIVNTDLKGYIPKSLVKSLTTKQASLVATICQWIDRQPDAGAYRSLPACHNFGPRPTRRVLKIVPASGDSASALPASTESAPASVTADAVMPVRSFPTRVAGDETRPSPHRQASAPQISANDTCSSNRVELPAFPPRPPKHRFGAISLLILLLPCLVAFAPATWVQATGQRAAVSRPVLFVAALVFCARYLYRAFVGTSVMSTRRKLMIASWSSPAEGSIHGALDVDMSAALAFIDEQKRATGEKVTVTTLVVKAVAMALRGCPQLNGRLVLGEFIPFPTVDISCLVAMERNEAGRKVSDLGNVKIKGADTRSVKEIAATLRSRASRVRGGKDADFEKSKGLLKSLPTWVLRHVVSWVGFLGAELGLSVPCLGVRPFPFGSCMVTSVGMLGLDMAWAPFTPFAHVPLLVCVGAVNKRVVAVDDQAVVRPMMTITATLDHRFVDGQNAATLAKIVKDTLQNPELLTQRLR